jgi:hypothetical protein
MTVINIQMDRKTSPMQAVGRHAEILAEMTQRANGLLKLVEAERTGVFDGLGQRFWVESDALLVAAKKLVQLAEERTGVVPR